MRKNIEWILNIIDVPIKLLLFRPNVFILVKFPILLGMLPLNLFVSKFNTRSCLHCHNLDGSGPSNWLLPKFNTWMFRRCWHILSRILPLKLFPYRFNVIKEDMLNTTIGIGPFRVLDSTYNVSNLSKFPISCGMLPV